MSNSYYNYAVSNFIYPFPFYASSVTKKPGITYYTGSAQIYSYMYSDNGAAYSEYFRIVDKQLLIKFGGSSIFKGNYTYYIIGK